MPGFAKHIAVLLVAAVFGVAAAQAGDQEEAEKAEAMKREAFRSGMERIVADLNLADFDSFLDSSNREDMLEQLAELDKLHEEAAAGGGERAMDRLRSRGKLPVQIPRSMTQVKAQREDLPFDLGCTAAEMKQIEDAIGRGESPPRNLGDPLFQYGIEGWGPTKR